MAPNVHQSQAPLLGMLTGPLISRMSLVAATLVVVDGERDGMTRALELVFIGDDGVSRGFQKSGRARSRRIGRCATGSNRCAQRETIATVRPGPWPAVGQMQRAFARRPY